MFKKIPYGVKVRVRGNEQDGFIAEYAIGCPRFLPFINNWNIISPYTYTVDPYTPTQDTFATFDLAKEAAMSKYDMWINFYKKEEETKRVSKARRKVLWKSTHN